VKRPVNEPVTEPETRMQKAIQLFEEDFARWGLHVPPADAAARRSGAVHQAGWHVLYDFGWDNAGEFLDYYAALRDATDPAVTDDWHVRLYDTGDRAQLPTVLEAYMYSRDPTPEELARARRKFANPPAPVAPPKPAILQPVNDALAAAQTAPAPSAATAPDEPPAASDDIALEVGLDLALAGVEPVPGGDTLASWLMTPAFGSDMVEPARPAAPAPKPAPQPKSAAPADDDVPPSDLVFVSEPPPARISGRISNPAVAITTDDDTFTISMSDDETPDDVQGASRIEDVAGDAIVAGEAVGDDVDAADGDVAHMDMDVPDDVHGDVVLDAGLDDGAPDDDDSASVTAAEPRHSLVRSPMLTTDIAAVADSFDPWWYRRTTRRIAVAAAAVIAIVLVGSAVSHFRSAPTPDAASPHAAPSAAHAPAAQATTPALDAADQDASGTAGSAQPSEGSTPDSLPVASAPSTVTADPANPAADDGIARPAGPQSVPPIRRSGTPRASLGPGRTTVKSGSALP
jgi:hypothetical protein